MKVREGVRCHIRSIRLIGAVLLLLHAADAGAQARIQKKVRGVVTDTGMSMPVSLVHVINKATGGLSMTDYKGEFEITASPGDLLAFVKDGYLSRTVTVTDTTGRLPIFLSAKPAPPGQDAGTEMLPEVTVYGKSYEADSLLLRREYERYFPSPPPSLKDAIGSDGSLDLNAFISRMMTPWDREFSERLLAYEQKKYIDKVFTPELVKGIVDVPDKDLDDFMKVCRPSYLFLATATEYDLVKYVRDAYRLYLRARYGETLDGKSLNDENLNGKSLNDGTPDGE